MEKKISTIGNKGLFTKEIDEAQLNFKIDIGVHSLKDLPTKLPEGLIIGAVLKRDDLKIVRPHKFNNPKDLSKILGKQLIKDVRESDLITLKILK